MKVRNSNHASTGLVFEHDVRRIDIETDDGQRWAFIDDGVGLRLRCLGTVLEGNDHIAVYPEGANGIRVEGVVSPASRTK